MEDPGLNRRIDETRELATRWGQFRDFLNMATKGEKVTPEAEAKFLELKTRIAMLHDGFMTSLKHDHKVGQQVLGIISQCIMLRRVPAMSGAEMQKLELDWNEAYLLMTETIANLDEERLRLASINIRTYKMQKAKELALARFHNLTVHPLFRLCFVFFFFGFVFWAVPNIFGYEWLRLRTDLPFTAKPINKGIEFWRNKVNPEFPYDLLAEIPSDPYVADSVQVEAEQNIPQQLNAEFVINQLFNWGFSSKPEDLQRARSMIEGRRDFRREMLTNTRQRRNMLAFSILFKSTADAREFIELRQKNLASLKPDERAKIEKTVQFGRKANFVGIVISEDQTFRNDYLTKRYRLTPEQIAQ